MLPPSSQENTFVHAVASTIFPPCSVIDTSGASDDEPLHTPVGATARVTSKDAIDGMVLLEQEQ